MFRYTPQLLVIFAVFLPGLADAADLNIRPFLIDKTVEPREFLQEQVSITNNTNRKLNVYATVNEITVDKEGEILAYESPIMTDRTKTIASWVEVKRGRIEIQPGETEAVDLGFRIHPNAVPGEYHVFIGFGAAEKRFQAVEAARAGELDGVIVKLTIEDKRTEYLRISGFIIDRFVTSAADKKVEIELENLGDVPATPQGEIIFFTSNGEEIDAIPVNTDLLMVPPGETVTITSELPLGNQLGRFKANLALQYGETQRASLYDTTQFFMMPLHILLLMLGAAVLLSLIIFMLLHRTMAVQDTEEHGVDVPLFVKDGHEAEPKDHDIDLKNKS
jgi:hypothetical protein